MAPKSEADPAKESLVREVLSTQFGREVSKVKLNLLSNNTTVYMVTLKASTKSANGRNNGASQPGTQPLPANTKEVVMRFTNPKAMLNNAVRVESEVAAMTLARDALKSLDPSVVPLVYAWHPDSNSEGNDGWALLQHMPGARMELAAFEKLETDDKRAVLAQIANILKLLQSYELPDSAQGYGGFKFADDGSVALGPTPINAATKRCDTYHELYSEYLHTQLAFMDKCDVVQGWKDSDLRDRIDKFAQEGFSPLLNKALEPKPRPMLVHGDFDLHNLLFSPENSITALLDWDFAHVASIADEYFYSFDSIKSLVPPVTSEPSINKLRDALLHGLEQTKGNRKFEDMVNWEVADMTDRAFADAGVQRPVDMMPTIEILTDLYWFIQNLSPGCFFMPGFRARHPAEKLAVMREGYKDGLEKTLSGWGY